MTIFVCHYVIWYTQVDPKRRQIVTRLFTIRNGNNMAVVFFGILSEEGVKYAIENWVNIAGPPDIFAEREGHYEKYSEKLLGKYEVVSIEEALKRYPDADIWITYGQPASVPSMLLNKVPPERIHFLEADLEYRKGCKYLGNFMIYREDSVSPCCVTGHMPVFKVVGDFSRKLAYWKSYTTKLIDAVQDNKPIKCNGCHMLKYGFYRKSVKLNTLTFATSMRGDICNFACSYCFAKDNLDNLKKNKTGLTTYEMLQQISQIPELVSDDLIILLSNGEFTANKHCNEMLDIFLNTKWKIDLTSNMSIYREKLAALVEDGRVVSIVTSLDAGTRETFNKIKQRDMFDRVVGNLRKYPVAKTNLYMKYIFLEGINDNEEDTDGFYELVKEFGATIMFSSNLTKPYTEKMRELAIKITKKAKADGVKIHTTGNFIHPDDAKYIRENYT